METSQRRMLQLEDKSVASMKGLVRMFLKPGDLVWGAFVGTNVTKMRVMFKQKLEIQGM